jgi:hypothetical protein
VAGTLTLLHSLHPTPATAVASAVRQLPRFMCVFALHAAVPAHCLECCVLLAAVCLRAGEQLMEHRYDLVPASTWRNLVSAILWICAACVMCCLRCCPVALSVPTGAAGCSLPLWCLPMVCVQSAHMHGVLWNCAPDVSTCILGVVNVCVGECGGRDTAGCVNCPAWYAEGKLITSAALAAAAAHVSCRSGDTSQNPGCFAVLCCAVWAIQPVFIPCTRGFFPCSGRLLGTL